VAGRQLLDQRRLTGIDKADVLRRSAEWQRRIGGETGGQDVAEDV
jgi:hypothetical protein